MQTVVLVVFVLISALIIGSGVMVVTVRNVIHSALWLITSFFGVGALYLLMEAEFVAVIQVLVYVGAISILVLFAIMLTRHVTGEGVRQLYQRWWLGLLTALALFGVIIVPTVSLQQWNIVPPGPQVPAGQPSGLITAVEIGTAFMRDYLIPFEVASVLLLVALVGAIVVAYEERARRRRVLTLAEEYELRRRQAEEAAPATNAETLHEA
jgi:NADH-quinone oxidoreductase subunit J